MNRIALPIFLLCILTQRPAVAQAFGVKPGSTFGALRPYLIKDLYSQNVYRSLGHSLPVNWSIFPPEANRLLKSYEIRFSDLGVVSEIKGYSTLQKRALVDAAQTVHLAL